MHIKLEKNVDKLIKQSKDYSKDKQDFINDRDTRK
jgi:hypothetical protein